MIFWNLTGSVPLAELVGNFAVLFEVSPALREKALTDHATVNSIIVQLSAPLACFLVLSGVGHCTIHQ
jgi:hypothetical protein